MQEFDSVVLRRLIGGSLPVIEAAQIRLIAHNQVREITAAWLEQYNEIRPHDALGSLPPARYRERLLAAETPV
jgi:Integrase core domain